MQPVAAIALAFGLVLAVPAAANPPAAVPAPSHGAQKRAEASLQKFATGWMQGLERHEARNKQQPKLVWRGGSQVAQYMGWDEGVRIEVRPTGRASAPYVGILRYTEVTYVCAQGGGSCRAARRTPITEIFRFQNGKWIY